MSEPNIGRPRLHMLSGSKPPIIDYRPCMIERHANMSAIKRGACQTDTMSCGAYRHDATVCHRDVKHEGPHCPRPRHTDRLCAWPGHTPTNHRLDDDSADGQKWWFADVPDWELWYMLIVDVEGVGEVIREYHDERRPL